MNEQPLKITRGPVPDVSSSEILSQLRVNAYLMRLDPGLFCVVVSPTGDCDDGSGLPGVRLSIPPGPSGRPDAVTISGFRVGGWLTGQGDAALVRVAGRAAQVLVTIYQTENAPEGQAPNLQVTRLLESRVTPHERGETPPLGLATPTAAPSAAASSAAASSGVPARSNVARSMELLAHIQGVGDVGAMVNDWLGEPGSRRWIEGFAVAPTGPISPRDIEYQAVFGPDWLSPWTDGGQFCGSRAMALPVLGLRVRLRNDAAATHRVGYSATFVDGSRVGPVFEGEPCESPTLAPLESFRLELHSRPVTLSTDEVAEREASSEPTASRARRTRRQSVPP